MKNFRFMKPYPLFKLEQEEVPKGETKSIIYKVYVKIAEPMNWICLYTTGSRIMSELAYNRLQELFDVYIIKVIIEDELYFPMFVVNGAVYKTQYVFPEQSCICGEQIKGNKRYTEFKTDYEKFDYVQDVIFFYEKNTCLVKGNQVFVDGELIYDSFQLKEVLDELCMDYYELESDPYKFISYLQKKYKIQNYTCNTYNSYNIGDLENEG